MPGAPGHPQPLSRRGRARSRRRDPASGAAVGTARPTPDGPAAPGAGGWRATVLRRRRPAPRASAPVRRRRTIVLAGMGVLTAAGVALALAGVAAVRNSTVGRYQAALAPSDPGYQAYVVPTPTMAAVVTGADQSLAGMVLLALEPGDHGGSVIVVPPATLVPRTDAGMTTPLTLGQVYHRNGVAAAVSALARTVNAGVSDYVVVDSAHWNRLVAPVAPIEVTLDHPVAGWPAGRVSLAADEVGRFLTVRGAGESDLDRLDRQASFWTAWLGKVEAGGEDAVPGEVATGLGRFVRGIASGPSTTTGLPVVRYDTPTQHLLAPDQGQVAALVADAIPLPTSPAANTRVRVRLLNGTHDKALTTDAARALVAAGAEIVIAGNAPTLDVGRTTIDYSGTDRKPLADRLAASSGFRRTHEIPVGDEKLLSSDDEIDVTVILGADVRDLIGR